MRFGGFQQTVLSLLLLVSLLSFIEFILHETFASNNIDIVLTHQTSETGLQWNVLVELQNSCDILNRRLASRRSTWSEFKTTTLWATDFHISPIEDIKNILGRMDKIDRTKSVRKSKSIASVHVLDNSLSGHCHLSGTCADMTIVQHLNMNNGISLGTCPNELRDRFYNHYTNSDQKGPSAFRQVDAFLCLHAASLCELYMPFNRTMIIIASTRYEIGRGEEDWMYGDYDSWSDHFTDQYDKLGFDEDEKVQRANKKYAERWQLWNTNLQRINGGAVGAYEECPDETPNDNEKTYNWFLNLVQSTFPACKQVSRRHHVIGANNMYDKYYIQYFTGIRDVLLLPSTAQHVNGIHWEYPKIHMGISNNIMASSVRNASGVSIDRYINEGNDEETLDDFIEYTRETAKSQYVHKSKKHFFLKPVLLGPSHSVHSSVHNLIKVALKEAEGNATDKTLLPQIKQISDVYPGNFEYADLANHPAVIFLPYTVSFMSFYEFYSMGVPIFLPTVRLLTQWHIQYRLLSQRSWPMTRHRPQRSSLIPRYSKHKAPKPSLFRFDPNNEFNPNAIRAWLELSDFYTWPHVILFDSQEDLIQLLTGRESLVFALKETSANMRNFMSKIENGVTRAWDAILEGVQQDNVFRQYTKSAKYPLSLNDALQEQYGYQLDTEHCYREKREEEEEKIVINV